jgi:hypothetical protein
MFILLWKGARISGDSFWNPNKLNLIQTFYIADPTAKGGRTPTKAARACDACYETVFPLLGPLTEEEESPTAYEESPSLQNMPPCPDFRHG